MSNEKTKERCYEVAEFRQKGSYETPPTTEFSPLQERKKLQLQVSPLEILMCIVILFMCGMMYNSHKDSEDFMSAITELQKENKAQQQELAEQDKQIELLTKNQKATNVPKEQKPDAEINDATEKSSQKAKNAEPAKVTTVAVSNSKNKKKEVGETIETVRGGVPMYSKPDEDSKKIASIPKDTTLKNVEVAEGGFLKVEYKGKVGYVFYYKTTWAENKEPISVVPAGGTTTVLKGKCDLREKPYLSSTSLTQAYANDVLEIIAYEYYFFDEGDGWAKVRLKNTNWVGHVYLDVEHNTNVYVEYETVSKTTNKTTNETTDETTDEATNVANVEKSERKGATKVAKGATKVTGSSAANSKEEDASTKIEELIMRATKLPLMTTKGEAIEKKITVKAVEVVKKKQVKNSTIMSGKVTGTVVNIRQKPTTNSKIKGCLSKGKTVFIRAQKGRWYKIRKGKKTGWMYGKYIKIQKYGEDINLPESSVKEQDETSNKSSKAKTLKGIAIKENDGTKKASKATMKAYAKKLCIEKYGWSAKNFKDLDDLWEEESGWNPNCVYGSCHGIPQMNADAHELPKDYYDNWKVQIRKGLEYILGRYKTPSNAWAHFCNHSPHWY